jgi:hypothetical protein
MPFLYRPTVLLAAALLFLAEPLAAKQLLPLYGGAAAVWITCLVFFQAALLAGYGCAHFFARRNARVLHLLLLAAAVVSALFWVFAPNDPTAGNPITGILLHLVLWLGLPFLALGATSPLLQVWLKRTYGGDLPYSLYSWSNTASLTALLAYPTLIEPALTLRTQRIAWTCGFAVFAFLSALIAGNVAAPEPLAADAAPRPSRHRYALWFALAMAGAMQLSAVTAHLTGNVAAIPLLWVLPLAVYLATFIVAFQDRVRIPAMPLAGVAAVMLIATGNFLANPRVALPIGLGVGLFLSELAATCLLVHTALFCLRPATERDATGFYLTLAAGGAAGAIVIGIVAPLVFRADYDLPLTLVATAAVAVAIVWPDGQRTRLLWTACAAILLVLTVQLHAAYSRDALLSVRNFYGCLRVTQTTTAPGVPLRTLLHGTITHGTEIFTPRSAGDPRVPTTYYAPDSGIGLALAGSGPRNIGIVGLGAGTLAAYAHPGDRIRFYEINPAVEPIARSLFSYLSQTPATLTMVAGDGRAALSREAPQSFDVLVLDAFSGDAIPLHLLTLEAMRIYQRQLAPAGILAFHISNQYVDLEPELRELAQATGMEARVVTSEGNESTGEFKATWVLMSATPAGLAALGPAAHPLRRQARLRAWTDDHSSLITVVRW